MRLERAEESSTEIGRKGSDLSRSADDGDEVVAMMVVCAFVHNGCSAFVLGFSRQHFLRPQVQPGPQEGTEAPHFLQSLPAEPAC